MPYGQIIIDDNKPPVLFEIGGPYVGEVSDEGIIQELQEKFASVLDLVKSTAENTYNGLRNIEQKATPDEIEVCFGVKLTGEAGVVFAKAGSEGAFQIKLKWKTK
ncbi:hypothetical protein JWG39_08575 [Desulforhopalus vacuolatus]|uniref:CU044_2847 family protein n=1 Tax=Desulforhopalus vacuolatus TaxID=40414 RepID=UPI0019642B1F|nr:CU044_2847 family protein [Desulforhopalus vacuolatus]MBM9519870.1 hypothetical protein [Desulforhopalus vacuolatus]